MKILFQKITRTNLNSAWQRLLSALQYTFPFLTKKEAPNFQVGTRLPRIKTIIPSFPCS